MSCAAPRVHLPSLREAMDMTFTEVYNTYRDELGVDALEQITEYNYETHSIRYFIYQVKLHEAWRAHLIYNGEVE